jgi:hypothetical protein
MDRALNPIVISDRPNEVREHSLKEQASFYVF